MKALQYFTEAMEKKDEVLQPFFWMNFENEGFTEEFNNCIKNYTSVIRTKEQVVELVKKYYGDNVKDEDIEHDMQAIDALREKYKQHIFELCGTDDVEKISKHLGYNFEENVINGFPYELICQIKY